MALSLSDFADLDGFILGLLLLLPMVENLPVVEMKLSIV